jgi:hypothetical protein
MKRSLIYKLPLNKLQLIYRKNSAIRLHLKFTLSLREHCCLKWWWWWWWWYCEILQKTSYSYRFFSTTSANIKAINQQLGNSWVTFRTQWGSVERAVPNCDETGKGGLRTCLIRSRQALVPNCCLYGYNCRFVFYRNNLITTGKGKPKTTRTETYLSTSLFTKNPISTTLEVKTFFRFEQLVSVTLNVSQMSCR